MKRLVKTLCLLMVAVTMLSTVSFAAEAADARASSYFMMTSTYIDRSSSSKLDIWFEVTGTGGMDVIGVETIKLQRSTDRTNWTTVKTYHMDDYSQMTDTNTALHADCVTYYGSSGYYYRAYVTFYAKDSRGTGRYDRYTATV